ncbi:hypothetical protein HanXRQr2_Chr10g0441881 [Helianthus annuus]|uniref:Uncharacterized protein n=1 Tax=Helianthus annuus TaxID=4232 RepID=A0A9K3N4S8_HELAN|nr:hypothetical protein HanXRQr2_Chr10g0441881 [Helianthus annuus]
MNKISGPTDGANEETSPERVDTSTVMDTKHGHTSSSRLILDLQTRREKRGQCRDGR